VICDAEAALDVLSRHAKHYHKMGKYLLDPLVGNGLIFSEDEFWRSQRTLINPAFHAVNLKQMVNVMVSCTSKCLEKWAVDIDRLASAHACTSRPPSIELELHRSISALSLDIIASAVLGSGFSESPETIAAVYNAFTSVLDDIQGRNVKVIGLIPVLNRLPTAGYRRIKRGVQRIQTVVTDLILKRQEGQTHSLCDGKDLLDLLLEVRDPATGKAMDFVQIKDECMTFVMAGHEATANLLSWCLHSLMTHPDAWNLCVEEVDAVLVDKALDYDSLKELKFIDACLEETLRLYPPVPWYRRQAISDHTIAFGEGSSRKQILVPKGTCVSVNAFLLHREPKHWGPDAERFIPHRFLERTKRPVCAYMPFGAGPRACIGQNFAKLEAKVQLAAIVSRFKMDLTPGQKVVPDLNLTLRPRSGITALVTHRQAR